MHAWQDLNTNSFPLLGALTHRSAPCSTLQGINADCQPCACMRIQDDYQSGAIHHVVLGAAGGGPLAPDTEYFYSCGDPALGMSEEFSFRTPPAVGPDSFPYRFFSAPVMCSCSVLPGTEILPESQAVRPLTLQIYL